MYTRTQVVLNATTLGNVLLEATKKAQGGSGSGSIKRKIGSALRALTDNDVLREWIYEQVLTSFLCLLMRLLHNCVCRCFMYIPPSLQVCDSIPQSNEAGREAEMERLVTLHACIYILMYIHIYIY